MTLSAFDEGGFTLIELLLVVAILPLVVGAISVALLAVFANENSTANSLTSSSDAQVSSATFVQDVQSANWISLNGLQLCGGAPSGSSLILSLSPDNLASAGIKNIISYVQTPNSGTNTNTITREACTGGANSASKRTVISHNALPTTTLTINPSSVQSSANSGWVAASGSSSIKLLLTEPVTNHTASPATTYSYSLSAVPRTTGTAGASPSGVTPILPVEFLGTSCPNLNLTGGGALVNSEGGDGVSGSGFAGVLSSQGACTAAGGPIGPHTSGTLNSQSPLLFGVTNPFATLSPPPIPTTTGLGAGSCSTVTSVCTSGLYTATSPCGATPACTALYGSGSLGNATFDPSQGPKPVIVFTVPVTIKNTNVIFEGNTDLTKVTYWFQQGLTISTGANVTFGSATFIFGSSPSSGNALSVDSQSNITAPIGGSGLIFYIPPGTATVNLGSGITGTLSGAPTPYDGIAVWDDSSGLFSLGQGNGGGPGLTATFGGIYDPLGTLSIAGNYKLNATFMVVNNASVQTSQVTMTG